MESDEFRRKRWTPFGGHGEEAFRLPLYTLARKTDDTTTAETKQVSMLGATAFRVQKRDVVEGRDFYYHNGQHPGAPIKDVVQVYYQFKNEERRGWDAMPAANVSRLSGGFNGRPAVRRRGRIDHTPKDDSAQSQDRERVRCRVRAQADRFQKIAGNTYDVEYEITLRQPRRWRDRRVGIAESAAPGACCNRASVGQNVRVGGAVHSSCDPDGTAVLKYRCG